MEETQVVELQTLAVHEYIVPSAEVAGSYYQVYVTEAGDWQCDCRWGNRHSGDNNVTRCWHAKLALLLECAEDLLGYLHWQTMDEARRGNPVAQAWLLSQAVYRLASRSEWHKASDAASLLSKYMAAISIQGAAPAASTNE